MFNMRFGFPQQTCMYHTTHWEILLYGTAPTVREKYGKKKHAVKSLFIIYSSCSLTQ